MPPPTAWTVENKRKGSSIHVAYTKFLPSHQHGTGEIWIHLTKQCFFPTASWSNLCTLFHSCTLESCLSVSLSNVTQTGHLLLKSFCAKEQRVVHLDTLLEVPQLYLAATFLDCALIVNQKAYWQPPLTLFVPNCLFPQVPFAGCFSCISSFLLYSPLHEKTLQGW